MGCEFKEGNGVFFDCLVNKDLDGLLIVFLVGVGVGYCYLVVDFVDVNYDKIGVDYCN